MLSPLSFSFLLPNLQPNAELENLILALVKNHTFNDRIGILTHTSVLYTQKNYVARYI